MCVRNLLLYIEDTKIAAHLIQFGRIGYVTDRAKIKGKMKPRSMRCVMVGYASNHSADTYLMYNPRTRKVIMSRDIQWADFNRPLATDDLEIHRSESDSNQNREDDTFTLPPNTRQSK